MARSKACFKCQIHQPLTEFYKHSQMADGHLNKCKTCTKKDVAIHRGDNLEKVRAYDRKRGRLAHRIKQNTRISKAWREQDKRRASCHNKVRRAILNGSLISAPCIKCGDIKSIAHHDDYDKPLHVIWLCQPCHKQHHKILKAKV